MSAGSVLRRHLVDAWILALVLAAVVEIAVSDLPGSKPVAALVAAATALPMLARRRLPLAGPLTYLVGLGVASFFLSEDIEATATPVLLGMTASWLIGSGNDRRRALLGLALGYAGVQTLTAHFQDTVTVGDVIFTSLLVVGPWTAGRAVRSRARYGAELRLRTTQLETAREARARAAVAEERSRIARELHDVVAHSISVMTIQAGAARMLLDEDPGRAEEPLLRVEETGRTTLSEMRRLLGVLRRDMAQADALDARPSLEHLPSLLRHYEQAGLEIELDVTGEQRALPSGLDLAAYRVVQEALTNTLKHARAKRAVVSLAYGPGALDVAVADDGVGPTHANGSGHGLVGMKERAAVYGGTFEAGRRPEGGFAVRVRFPLERGR